VNRGSFALSGRGLRLVMGLELRQRVRSVRWYVALGIWLVALVGLSLLVLGAASYLADQTTDSLRPVARVLFSIDAFLVMFAMLLILPALSAGSINGDRTEGTLAILQVSQLSAAEIVLGKLLAGWITGLAFLVAALPSLLPTAILGGVGPLYLLRLLAMIAMLALCITAVGLGLSAMTARQLGSVVLAYVIVIGVTFVLPLAWGTSSLIFRQDTEVVSYSQQWDDGADTTGRCVRRTEVEPVIRSDRTIFLMWPNPMVLLADTAPTRGLDATNVDDRPVDLLQIMSVGIHMAAHPTDSSNFLSCRPDQPGYPTDVGPLGGAPVWPFGLGIWVLAGAGASTVAIRRLRTPMSHVASGTRIA
jgi:ABC-2 type transport system permease protein